MKVWYEMVNDLETKTGEVDVERVVSRTKTRLPRRRPVLRAAAAAAAVLLLTACGVVAARFGDWFPDMATDPRDPAASEAVFASMGTVIGQSQTIDGVTATLQGAIRDGNTMYLSVYLEGLEEVEPWSTQVEKGDSWVYYSEDAVEPEAVALIGYDDLAAQLIWSTSIRRPLEPEAEGVTLLVECGPGDGREMQLHLEGVTVDGATVPVFDFAFTPENKECAALYLGQVPVTLEDGTEITVTGARLSPLGAWVECTGQAEPEGMKLERLLLQDGSTFWGSSRGSQIGREDGKETWTGVFSMEFDRVLDPATVAGLEFGGTEIRLEAFSEP